jgi:hypothetical protein
MPIQLFPLNGGINGHIDHRLLPDGALADAVNVELDRDGRLRGRARYAAQAQTVYGAGTHVAYDLFNLKGRLFAFGDAHSYGFPVDIYEMMPDGAAARWRPTSQLNATTPRLPRATKVRELARPPDQAGGISNMGCAAMGGYVALVWNASDNTQLGYVNVVSAAKNQPVVFAQLSGLSNMPCSLLRAVALSDRFIVLGTSNIGTENIRASRLITASDEAFVDLGTLATGTIVTYAACKVAGADQFVIAYNIGGTVTVRRFDNTGTLVVPSGGQYATIAAAATRIAVEASSTANQVTVLLNVGGTVTAYGYNLSTGATIGNAAAFSGETCVEVSLVRKSSTVVQAVASVTSETAPTVMTNDYTVASSTFGGTLSAVTDAQLATSAVFSTETFMGIRVGDDGVGGTPNFLVSSGTDNEEVTPQICKDFEIAGVASTLLPDIAQDSSTGKYYWTNASASPDGDLTPRVTEFELNSTDRRQVAQFGSLLYIAGGCPLVFDGMSAVEAGFLTRPRIISLTPSNSTGELLSGAEYDYRQHWEWVDSDQNLHLSPPSAITTVELGGSDDTVAAVCTTAHSMRRNRGNNDRGSVVRSVLSRTLATVARTAAVLRGTRTLDPPSSPLNGLTFQVLHYNATTAVVTVETVTFNAGATTSAAVVSQINAAFNLVTASAPGGVLILTADTEGEHITINADIATFAVGAIFGFSTFQGATGTTTHTKGQNFQRAASEFHAASAAVAAYVTVTDLRIDQSDPIEDDDLIRQQVLYSQGIAAGAHHAPPPSEYIWPGKDRIGFFGQPHRSRYTQSKLAVQGEPIECAAEGFLNFSGTCPGGDIEAGAIVGDSTILWTRTEIWEVGGSGPARNGVGEFAACRRISRAGGLVEDGWQSLVQTDRGIFFQRASDQLCLLSSAGGVEWIGDRVQEYLKLYPVIRAAVYVPSKHVVAFAVRSTDGLTGGILRYDLEGDAWFFDNVGAVTALSEFEGRLAYVQAGIVYIQDENPGSGTFVPYHVRSGMFQGFQVLGYGQVNKLGFIGTYRDECTVSIYLSEDGVDYSTLHASWDLTDSEYDAGDPVVLLKEPAKQMRDTWGMKLEVTHDAADSEGVWIHAFALDTDRSPELTRKGAAHNL